MQVEQRAQEQLRRLIAEAAALEAGPGSTPAEFLANGAAHNAKCRGWLASARHAVNLICSPADAYSVDAEHWSQQGRVDERMASHAVRQFCAVLRRLADDVENGLVVSIAQAASAETLDDLLAQAREYHRREHRQGAGVLATAVYEDTIRRLARAQQLTEVGIPTDKIISDLNRADAISGVIAKRCRAASDVRNAALHAQWERFTLADVDEVLRLTAQLIERLGTVGRPV